MLNLVALEVTFLFWRSPWLFVRAVLKKIYCLSPLPRNQGGHPTTLNTKHHNDAEAETTPLPQWQKGFKSLSISPVVTLSVAKFYPDYLWDGTWAVTTNIQSLSSLLPTIFSACLFCLRQNWCLNLTTQNHEWHCNTLPWEYHINTRLYCQFQ